MVDYDQLTPKTTRPYENANIVTLYSGHPVAHYPIHSQILRKSAPLHALVTSATKKRISVPELDNHTAHALIHYLYTGTLQWIDLQPRLSLFSLALCLYSTAVQYELPGLAKLARDDIIRSGDVLTATSIFNIVKRDASRLHLENDVWYWQYLEQIVQREVKEDPEQFKQPDFIARVEGNTRLLQIVWKTVMDSFASGSVSASSVRDLASEAETPVVASTLTDSEVTTQDSLHQLLSPPESVVGSPHVLEQADDLIEPQKLELDASISTDPHTIALPEPERPMPDTVNSDNKASLMNTQSPASQSQAVQIIAASVEDIKEPQHIRADSVVAEDAVAPVGLKKKINKKKTKGKTKKSPPAVV